MPVKINNESGYLDKPGAIHKAVKSLPNYFEKVLHHTNTINSFCFFNDYWYSFNGITGYLFFFHWHCLYKAQ